METRNRCQSCGMPLGEGFFGTEHDGTPATEWCHLCYQQGDFVEPELTLNAMIARSVDHMIGALGMPPERAESLAQEVIPTLRRWRRD